jgi:hypothetical protein
MTDLEKVIMQMTLELNNEIVESISKMMRMLQLKKHYIR